MGDPGNELSCDYCHASETYLLPELFTAVIACFNANLNVLYCQETENIFLQLRQGEEHRLAERRS